MLDINQLELTSGNSGCPEANILKDLQNPSLKEFRQKLEEKSINVFTKKELMKYLIQMETKSQLGTLYNITKETQDKILEKLLSIDQLPISTFEKTMQSERLIEDGFNKEDYINQLSSVKNIERIAIDEEGDISAKNNEYSIIVRELNTVGDALARMNNSKNEDGDGKGYNCVFLLGENNKFLGLFTRENLLDKPPYFRLRDVKERVIDVSGGKNITDDEAILKMKEYGINAIPILDSSGSFYGVLSLRFKEKNEIENSAVMQLTKLNLSLLER